MAALRKIGLFALGVVAFLAAVPAYAQFRMEFSYCDRLQAQYRGALERSGNSRGTSGQRMVQMDRLSRELAQAQVTAQRLQCTGGFFIFGPRPAPQCPGVMAQIQRLSRQLSQLRGSGFDLFGRDPAYEAAQLRDMLIEGGCGIPNGGGYRTLCVRSCDGYYFPIESSASRSRFETDAQVCQSMYSRDGEAELFIQSNSDDVADATTLSGERYGDQSYAFLYRDTYAPACTSQLHEGIAALKQRYLSRVPLRKLRQAAPSTIVGPVPVPKLRQPASEDPETLANAFGRFEVKPVAPAPVAMSAVSAKGVRLVGPAYYADLFDLSKARKEMERRERQAPMFTLVGPASAAEPTPPPPVD